MGAWRSRGGNGRYGAGLAPAWQRSLAAWTDAIALWHAAAIARWALGSGLAFLPAAKSCWARSVHASMLHRSSSSRFGHYL
jgi:hypothetical protein